MARIYELKCLCGFSAGVRKGIAARGKLYVFYGCSRCNGLVKFNLHEIREDEKKALDKGVCPKCKNPLIDYDKEEGKIGFTCPKCAKRAMTIKPSNCIVD